MEFMTTLLVWISFSYKTISIFPQLCSLNYEWYWTANIKQISIAAAKRQTNLSVLQGLLDDVEVALREGYYYHVGSEALWQHHGDMVVRMKNTLNAVKLKQVSTYFSIYL